MRFLPIVLLIGILFNAACVLVFRMKLDRRMDDKFDTFSKSLQSQLSTLTSSALSSIDAYFVSNSSMRVSSSGSSFSVPDKPREIFFRDLGSWDYDFFRADGQNVARVGVVYFRVGDAFPRGGVITAIYPDVCIVDGEGFVSNSSFSLARSSSSRPSDFRWDVPDTSYHPPKELTEYVSTINTMRK